MVILPFKGYGLPQPWTTNKGRPDGPLFKAHVNCIHPNQIRDGSLRFRGVESHDSVRDGDGKRPGPLVVANPGHIPWMLHTALTAARHRRLRAFATPFAFTASEVAKVGNLPLGRVSGSVKEQLSRRQVPDVLSAELARRGSLVEAAAVAARRTGQFARVMADFRDIVFDARVARLLEPGDEAVVCAYHAALATIRRSRGLGIRSVLDWPVAHHRFAQQILTEEISRRPDYAITMQFHRVPPRRTKRLDNELADADVVTVPSSFQKATFVESGLDENKITVIPFGVDSTRYRPPPQEPPGPFRVLFVGQLTQRKGLSYVIDAFRAANLPDAELVLVGAHVGVVPPSAQHPSIRRIPEVRPEQVPELYRGAHAFILLSLVEGLARVVLEAMASGLPVIATPNTGAEEVMVDERSGFIVPIRDTDAVVDRLRFLYDSPNRRSKIGAEARQEAERFTWEHYARRMVATATGQDVTNVVPHQRGS